MHRLHLIDSDSNSDSNSDSGVGVATSHIKSKTKKRFNFQSRDAFQVAAADNCPDGSKSGGSNAKGYFEATYAETCNDLVCQKGLKCVQVNKQFAKCCGGK
uniref:Uncharacterized protein n=1 Tax=Panagrolaimus superbus TaxID=310955 RepID=A0A914Z8Z3_9BILA